MQVAQLTCPYIACPAPQICNSRGSPCDAQAISCKRHVCDGSWKGPSPREDVVLSESACILFLKEGVCTTPNIERIAIGSRPHDMSVSLRHGEGPSVGSSINPCWVCCRPRLGDIEGVKVGGR